MREIEFRAWDGERMRDALPYMGAAHRVLLDCPDKNDILLVEEPSWIVMQYTGLKDKNGKKIFEGDIVITRFTGGKSKGKIMPYSSAAVRMGFCKDMTINCNEYNVSYCGVWADRKGETDNESRCDFDSWEVIGNIYESPELLEAE